ncbi:MAG: hypothetical protein A3K65_08255 [Euryarchaeota archaeon RBG_16_68_12]|nr:MAG: hypothetical protein A3K65_08255 [Euryarchaeota archaeon RBG_16_68_12]
MRAAALAIVALLLVGAIAAFVPVPAQAAPADWTFLVYMDADNNLEPLGIDNFLAMARVGSTAQVNIVVQFDRAVGDDARYGDWTDTKRFLVQRGMTPDPANAVANLTEVDMADPASLVAFAAWGIATYPARHVFLDVWDHGLGWMGVLTDSSSGQYMTTPELAGALAQIKTVLGRNVDIVGNDACRMTLEIMYELQPSVDFFVGSQKDEPLAGWPYDAFLGAVAADPSMTPVEVGSWLTSAYVASYRDATPQGAYSVTLSLVSSRALPALVATFAGFVTELNASVPLRQAQVMQARLATERYEKGGAAGGDDFDLYHFAENAAAVVGNPRLSVLAGELEAAIGNAVLANAVWDHPNPVNQVRARHAHGLSIWFPDTPSEPGYASLALSRDSGWGGFLAQYRLGVPTPIPTNARARSVDTNTDGLADRIVVDATPPQNGSLSVFLTAGPRVVASRQVPAFANQAETLNLTPALPGLYDVTVLYYVGSELVDLVAVANLSVQARCRFQGTVTDEHGNPLVGATVTLTNLRTRVALTATSTSAGYAVDAVIPDFFRDGDLLIVNASYGGRQASASLVASARDASRTADLVVDMSGPADVSGVALALAVAALAVAVLLAGIVVWQQRQIRGLRRRLQGP